VKYSRAFFHVEYYKKNSGNLSEKTANDSLVLFINFGYVISFSFILLTTTNLNFGIEVGRALMAIQHTNMVND
jgi:hypothetical protein